METKEEEEEKLKEKEGVKGDSESSDFSIKRLLIVKTTKKTCNQNFFPYKRFRRGV